MRASVLDPADVRIEDTWDTAGLRGTGSHHFRVDGAVVPERTFVPLVDPPCIDMPVVRIPTPAVVALAVAAVAIGAARGALDDVVELAQDKVPLLAPGPLATIPCSTTILPGPMPASPPAAAWCSRPPPPLGASRRAEPR